MWKDGTGQRHKTCDNVIDGKRCNAEWIETINPKAWIQIIINEIPKMTEDLVLENIDQINESIKSGIFIRNLQSCIMPWGKCNFYEKCYKGKDTDLVKAE